MQDLTRADLMRMTPARYLKVGYVSEAGRPRALLQTAFAAAASTQLLAAGLAPQELGFTAEAIRQLLPQCQGAPSVRLAAAMARARPIMERMIGQPPNPGLLGWLEDCAAPVATESDLVAFLAHLQAVQFQYGMLARMQP